MLSLCAEERYEGFGPTLMAEHLLKAKLAVDHETLRRWRMATGQHTVRRRKQKHRQWRERQPCFGAMVQLDGSHHDWFEGRGPKCVLMVMVDDATNQMSCRFFAEETTRASYDVLEGWIQNTACPAACMWIGTASIAAKGWRVLPSNWRGKRRKRSLGGRWQPWGSN